MKTGGILIATVGAGLFVWHLVRVQINPNYEGYASHQVMATNAVVVFVFGAVLYFISLRRQRRKRGVAVLRRPKEMDSSDNIEKEETGD